MESNHSLPPDISLADVLDIAAFQNLTDSFSQLTGIVTAILDIKGKVLVASGWQPICTQFHRKNPLSAQRCLESDTMLANQVAKGQKYNVYHCKNGLVDVAAPIILDNCHVGNIFTGQFFFAPPDMDFFIRQAEQFGFAKEEYLRMVTQVPVLSEEKLQQVMLFLIDLTTIIGNSSLDKKELFDLNKNLEQRVQTRTHELKEEMRFSDSLINSLPGVMYLFDQFGNFKRWNNNLEDISGYPAKQLALMSPLDIIAAEDRDRVEETICRVFRDGRADVEAGLQTQHGRVLPYLFTGYHFSQDSIDYLVGIGLDISDRVRAEREKEDLIASLQESLKKVKQLSGFLPICASCKKIRDDEGYWNQIEAYLQEHSEVEFSHGICPDCARKLYPNLKFPGL